MGSLPIPTQFFPRSGPRSMGKEAHCRIGQACALDIVPTLTDPVDFYATTLKCQKRNAATLC